MKIYFQDMKVYFQALKIYFQGLKILLKRAKYILETSINSFWNVHRQFVGRVFWGWLLAVCRWLLAVCRSVVAVGARGIVTSVYI